jgi:uncharacterized protein YegL
MKENLTEIVFVLDRSGSMGNLVTDTIGGFNSFLSAQQKEPGEAVLTTVLFDDRYEVLHNRVDIKNVAAITEKDYFTRGMTALLDSIGKTINSIGEQLSKLEESERPSKVIFVITTDGLENSSVEFSWEQIKTMITHQTNKYNWKFIFLGANIDSISVGAQLGTQYNANYSANTVGIVSAYSTVSETTRGFRKTGEINKSWDEELE